MRALNCRHDHQKVTQGGPHDDSVSYQTINAQNSQRHIFIVLKNHSLRLNQLQTPWSTVLPEKLTDRELIKKFPAFYET
jgi:hypothetical protein